MKDPLSACTSFVSLPSNPHGRDLVIGDVHGQAHLLEKLLVLADFNRYIDRVFMLGDLIDKGADSAALLERMDGTTFHSLMGNHEAMMVAAQHGAKTDPVWDRSGNEWAQSLPASRLSELSTKAMTFPLIAEVRLKDGGNIGLVHGEVPPGMSWDQIRNCQLILSDASESPPLSIAGSALWGRKRILADARMRSTKAAEAPPEVRAETWEASQSVLGIDWVLCGHTPLIPPEPRRRGNVIWLDTGACDPDGRLTAVDLRKGVYWQVGHDGEEYPERLLPRAEPPVPSWQPEPDVAG